MRRICIFVTVGDALGTEVLTAPENPGIGGSEFTAFRLGRLISETYPTRDVLLVTNQPAAQFAESSAPNVRFEDWNTWRARPNDCAIVTNSQFRYPEVVRCVEAAGRVIGWSRHPFDQTLKSHLLPRMDAVVSPGVFALKSNRALGTSGIHIPHYIFPSSATQWDAPKPGGPINFVSMSSGLAIKGFWDVLEIWRKIRTAVPRARLHIIGSTPVALPRRHENKADQGIGEDVRSGRLVLYGPVGLGKSELLAEMHIGLVNPRGLSESFVSTAFEMMAHGVPVVSSSRHGMYESMRYFPESQAVTIAGIARRAIALSNDPELLKELSVRSRAAVTELHDLGPTIATRWLRLADDDDLSATRAELEPLWPLHHGLLRVLSGTASLLHYKLRLKRRWRRFAAT